MMNDTNKTVEVRQQEAATDLDKHQRAWELAKRTASKDESLSETVRRAEQIRRSL